METEKCRFCESDCEKTDVPNQRRSDKYTCKYCGEYIISNRTDCLRNLTANDKFKIACVLNEYRLRDRNIQSDKRPICISMLEEDNKEGEGICKTTTELIADYPKTPQEILDRGLINLSRSVIEPFGFLYYSPEIRLMLSLFSKNSYIQTISELANIGYLTIDNPDAPLVSTLGGFNLEILKQQRPPTPRRFNITGKGWEYINRVSSKSDKVFVAMWFNEETEGIFKVIEDSCKRAGYKAERIDQIHHNDFIMDKVLNMIDDSKFVIADYTSISEEQVENSNGFKNGIRGGVYFEAGYARGKGKTVINLCRTDTIERLHFDVSQLNQIMWQKKELSSPDREFLIDRITQRIIQTVGRYPI